MKTIIEVKELAFDNKGNFEIIAETLYANNQCKIARKYIVHDKIEVEQQIKRLQAEINHDFIFRITLWEDFIRLFKLGE